MSNSRQTDLSALHPAIRQQVQKVRDKLKSEGHKFEIFEAYRSPQRQAYLYSQGRTGRGRIVTKAPPWSSYHQHGLAADFVLKINENWSWDTSGDNAESWARLHEVARQHGLEPLSWELPHLQMSGLKIDDLRAGQYPPGGDDSWAAHLEDAIIGWRGSPAAPPPPKIDARPPIEVATVEESAQSETRGASRADTGDIAQGDFGKVHALVEKWEGGYSAHPRDPGGPTNMGITLATLSEWRGHPVTADDVRQLKRDEALQIFRARYWTPIRGEEMPLSAAQVTYNTCVLSGPKRAATLLQEALNKQGSNIAVDGRIGSETLGACLTADQRRLVQDYCDLYESYLRGLEHFNTFGRGWMNRLAEIRKAASSWAGGTAEITGLTVPWNWKPAVTTLSFGEKGAQVEALQRTLVNLGYTVGETDGIFGSLTRAALLAFQADNNLQTTGEADAATWAALSEGRPRPLSQERLTATPDDLRQKGSKIIDAADKTKLAGWVSSVLGALGITNSAVVQMTNDPGQTFPAPDLSSFLAQVQQYLTAPSPNPTQAEQLLAAVRRLQSISPGEALSPENLRLISQLRTLIPQDVIGGNPTLANFLNQVETVRPQIRTIADVLPSFFADGTALQVMSKGLAVAASSVLPGFGGSLAVLGIGLAANYFANRTIKARVKDHTSGANTHR